MSQDEFTKLFTYIQREFASVHEELAKKADQSLMLEHFDGLQSLLENEQLESAALISKTNRHDQRIEALEESSKRHESWIRARNSKA